MLRPLVLHLDVGRLLGLVSSAEPEVGTSMARSFSLSCTLTLTRTEGQLGQGKQHGSGGLCFGWILASAFQWWMGMVFGLVLCSREWKVREDTLPSVLCCYCYCYETRGAWNGSRGVWIGHIVYRYSIRENNKQRLIDELLFVH